MSGNIPIKPRFTTRGFNSFDSKEPHNKHNHNNIDDNIDIFEISQDNNLLSGEVPKKKQYDTIVIVMAIIIFVLIFIIVWLMLSSNNYNQLPESTIQNTPQYMRPPDGYEQNINDIYRQPTQQLYNSQQSNKSKYTTQSNIDILTHKSHNSVEKSTNHPLKNNSNISASKNDIDQFYETIKNKQKNNSETPTLETITEEITNNEFTYDPDQTNTE
jgi:hypothetical protein